MSSAGSRTQTLLSRLKARRPDLEQQILTRVYGLGDSRSVVGARYLEIQRHAISAALDYGLAAIELAAGSKLPPLPPELLTQARLAARNGVGHETLLRRYCSANSLFADVVIEEAARSRLPRSELKPHFLKLTSSIEHLLGAVSEEFVREELSPLEANLQLRTVQINFEAALRLAQLEK
jgi:hypothetical protein